MADELRCHLGGGGSSAGTGAFSSTKPKKRDSMSSLHSLDLGPPNDFDFSDSDDSDSDENAKSNQNSEKSIGNNSEKDWLNASSHRHQANQKEVVDEVSFAPMENVLRLYGGDGNGSGGFCNIWHMIPYLENGNKRRNRMICLASIAVVFLFSFLVVGSNNDVDGTDPSSSSWFEMRTADPGEMQNKEDMRDLPPPAEEDEDLESNAPNLMAEAPQEIEQMEEQDVDPAVVIDEQEIEEQEEVRSCVLNGDFNADPPTSRWYAIHAKLEPIPGGGINPRDGNAMAITDRSNQQWGGIWQNIPPACLEENAWYEVRAYYHLVSSDNTNEEYTCDPTIFWNNNVESCPAISIRVDKELSEVGWSVGPHHVSIDGKWHEMYGAFRATTDMIQNPLSIFIARAPLNADIIVDDITMQRANQDTIGMINNDCSSSLIRNGNAETGDHRYWFIRGEGGDGSGTIQMSLGYKNAGFALKHVGYRSNRWRGLLQKLASKDCLTVGSTWKITAVFKYFMEDEVTGKDVPAECVKNDPYAVLSCPVFQVDFFTPGTKDLISTGPMVNEDADEFILGDWNRLEHTLEIGEEMVYHSDVWIYINSVEEGYNYEIDDIEMVPMV